MGEVRVYKDQAFQDDMYAITLYVPKSGSILKTKWHILKLLLKKWDKGFGPVMKIKVRTELDNAFENAALAIILSGLIVSSPFIVLMLITIITEFLSK